MYKLIMKQINAIEMLGYRNLENNKWHTKENKDEHMRNWNSQRRLEKMGKKQ